MKWKFWKRSNKSKTAKAKKGKRQQKSEDCTECDSLRAIVDELRSYRDKVVQQQQELDTLQDLLITTKQRVSEIISAHNEATEKSKREEEWQLEQLRSAILQMKKDHSEQMQALKISKEEVEKEFQEYKTAAEHEQGEVETLGTELADLKEQHRYEKEQLKMQVSQAVDPQSHAWVLSLRPQQPAFHLAQMDRNRAAPGVIQAPRRTGGLSYNPSTSAFHTYSSRDHDVFMAHRSAQQSLQQQQERPSPPITAEDEEVASILANALPPGEYVRHHFGH